MPETSAVRFMRALLPWSVGKKRGRMVERAASAANVRNRRQGDRAPTGAKRPPGGKGARKLRRRVDLRGTRAPSSGGDAGRLLRYEGALW